MQFSFNLLVNLLFGSGISGEIGTKAACYGRTALVVTGRGSAKKSGLLDKTVALLKTSGVESVIFDDIEPNPTTDIVYEGALFFNENNCDMVIGLGGGSIMDAAKAISFMSQNTGDFMDFVFARKNSYRAAPIVLVPTTCGTGSESNGFAVITNTKTGDKKSLRSNAIVAKLSLIDPDLMTTMPKPVLASVAFDALCHSMESYLSVTGTPITNIMALEAISLIRESLVPLYSDAESKDLWEKLTLASTLGGMCIGVTGVTAPHGMEHPASGLRDITHGKGLAALTPVIFERSICSAPVKFAEISKRLGGTDETDCVQTIRKLLADIGLTVTLGEQGVLAEDLDWMAENTMKVSAAGIANHPVHFNLADIKEIYKSAL